MDIDSTSFKQALQDLDRKRRALTVAKKSYWQELLPDQAITDHPFENSGTPYTINSDVMENCTQQIRHDGYFVTPPIIPQEDLDQLATCILKVTSSAQRSTYALLYDIFYEVLGRISNVLTPILGRGYQFVPDQSEAYYIDNVDHATGTGPHRDNIHDKESIAYINGLPTLINVWIPITNATTLNSCIHLIPLRHDITFDNGIPKNIRDKSFTWKEVHDMLQHVRAVPAQAGSVLAWDTNILHWGGTSSIFAKEPRLSMAAYFQSAAVPPYHKFTMDIPGPIPFDYRLYFLEASFNDEELRNDSFKKYQKLWYKYNNP